jgi:hypothetical protein
LIGGLPGCFQLLLTWGMEEQSRGMSEAKKVQWQL